jgi:hypothetical protein
VKTFIQHNIPKIKRIDSPTGRVYETPSGEKYPSVTAVVSLHSQDGIDQWRARVGDEEASKVSARASKRGTAIHTLCEDYIKRGEAKPSMFDIEMFTSMKPYLDRIDNVHCLETQLYSHHLEVAGTVDCIGEYDGKLSIIDFKTSSKPKQKEWIDGYFMQTAAYAVMFEELTKIPVPQIVIVIGVDDHGPQIFIEKRNNWIGAFIELRNRYREIKQL